MWGTELCPNTGVRSVELVAIKVTYESIFKDLVVAFCKAVAKLGSSASLDTIQ